MKFPKLISLTLLTVLTLIGCSRKKANNSRLAGMYKLLVFEYFDATTKQWQEEDFGKGGDSYIIYDGMGHMAVHITSKGYKEFPWLTEKQVIDKNYMDHYIDSLPSEQLRPALKEFASGYVYTANYSVDNDSNIITHDRLSSSIPASWGTQVKRRFSCSGDTLVLAFPDGSKRLKWIRQP